MHSLARSAGKVGARWSRAEASTAGAPRSSRTRASTIAAASDWSGESRPSQATKRGVVAFGIELPERGQDPGLDLRRERRCSARASTTRRPSAPPFLTSASIAAARTAREVSAAPASSTSSILKRRDVPGPDRTHRGFAQSRRRRWSRAADPCQVARRDDLAVSRGADERVQERHAPRRRAATWPAITRSSTTARSPGSPSRAIKV